VPEEVRADLELVMVETMDQVLEHALERSPETVAPPVEDSGDTAPGHYAH